MVERSRHLQGNPAMPGSPGLQTPADAAALAGSSLLHSNTAAISLAEVSENISQEIIAMEAKKKISKIQLKCIMAALPHSTSTIKLCFMEKVPLRVPQKDL